jgi:hypothetical protein
MSKEATANFVPDRSLIVLALVLLAIAIHLPGRESHLTFELTGGANQTICSVAPLD